MEPQPFTVSDGGEGIDVIVGTANGGGRRCNDAQRAHAFTASKGDFLFQPIRTHATVFVTLNFDDVLVANADDVGSHKNGIVRFCRDKNHRGTTVKTTLRGA